MFAEQVKTLVDQMPEPDNRGILSNVDLKRVTDALAALHLGGEATVSALVDMLIEPGTGDDVKARYALHALATLVCGRTEPERAKFAQALADKLADDRPKAVKECILSELQVCGGPEVAAAIGRFLDDLALVEAAALALAAIAGAPAAAEFRRALDNARGPSRLTLVQNLGVLGDKQAVQALAAAVGDDDAAVRTAAVWALANIGDPDGIDACLKSAERAAGYERIQAGKSRFLFAERLRDAGLKAEAQRVYGHVRKTSSDESEAYLREIADRALASI